MIQPSVFGQAIIITVYLPILALTGIEGKMFHPMAMTVIFALVAAFVLSLTFVPAMVALCITRPGQGRGERARARWPKRVYAPVLQLALRLRYVVVPLAVAAFVGAVLLFGRLGQEFVPTLDEQDIAMHAMRIPSTALTQSTADAVAGRKDASARFPKWRSSFPRPARPKWPPTRCRPTSPTRSSSSNRATSGPTPTEPKSALVQRMEEALEAAAGQQLRVHPADPDALQRADRRRARRRGGEGLRRRL